MKKQGEKKVRLEIRLDPPIQKVKPFCDKKSVSVSRSEIFRFAMHTIQPPKRLKQTDYFEFQQSKVPALEKLWADHLVLSKDSVFNDAQGEAAIKLSEIIGVGVGLTYATKLLNIKSNRVKTIPSSKKQKTLDFEMHNGRHRYEFETKSTLHKGNVGGMVAEVLAKKKKKNKKTAVRFGAVTLSRPIGDNQTSFIMVCDDNDFENSSDDDYDTIDFLRYYLPILSLTLDSSDYNVVSKRLKSQIPHEVVPVDRFPKQFEFRGVQYLGDVFDRRLNISNLRELISETSEAASVLTKLTSAHGVSQVFVGIDLRLLKLINELNLDGLKEFDGERFEEIIDHSLVSSVGDGVLLINITAESTGEVAALLPRNEVKERLSLLFGYARGDGPPRCGAPCRSREKYGQACQIKTYRGTCHFHR